ncbi:hypothetical protein BDK51DRAFT_31551 [Blyttiomyces helicus]|uniref:Uncharacterized protein n=1 Tax=Blyttiomyces helicus TaxID=388810 RepID=A0A4P9W2L2_9FUNG|nr:hypothetical protein BDK51DRAFT_31551 [Blyttiomyces helicus]|eukprot:RKO86471.1 hypothetical protein BDK51DRAFT_31551 [Blyttiomyces helicus]
MYRVLWGGSGGEKRMSERVVGILGRSPTLWRSSAQLMPLTLGTASTMAQATGPPGLTPSTSVDLGVTPDLAPSASLVLIIPEAQTWREVVKQWVYGDADKQLYVPLKDRTEGMRDASEGGLASKFQQRKLIGENGEATARAAGKIYQKKGRKRRQQGDAGGGQEVAGQMEEDEAGEGGSRPSKHQRQRDAESEKEEVEEVEENANGMEAGLV